MTHKYTNQDSNSGMGLPDIISLFEEVCGDAESFAKLSIRRPNRPSSDGVSNIYYETTKYIKEAFKNIETQPLIIPLISGAMEHITEMYAVSLKELLAGEFEPRRERYLKLMSELKNSAIALEWDETNRKIAEVIERLGLTPDQELLKDMPRVSRIMLNAFSFFDQYHTQIIKLAEGDPADGRPFLMRSLPRFSTTGEFYDSFRSVPVHNAIMLGMILPTYAQTTDRTNEWKNEVIRKYGDRYERSHESERISNMRRAHGKDFDPDVTVDKHMSRAVVGIKRGENIWLIIHDDESANHGKFINYHGERTSFMPFQVLFNEAPEPNTSCTDLALPNRNSWDLLKMLDEEQALWLPTFLWLLEKRFFTGPMEPEEVVLLPDMVKIENGNDNTCLPVVQKAVTVSVDPFVVPDIFEDIETVPEIDDFIRHLDVTPSELDGIVVTPRTPFADEKTYARELWMQMREALAFVTSKKLYKDRRENERWLTNMFVDAIARNDERLLAELANPESPIHKMSEHIIDGQPEIDADSGEVVMKWDGYRTEKKPSYLRTTVDDARRMNYSTYAVITRPLSLYGRRPPVVINIQPKTVEDLAFLMGVPADELPWQFHLTGKCTDEYRSPFSGEKKVYDPMVLLRNPYKSLPSIKIAFGKREYKEIFPENLLSKKQIEELIAKAKRTNEETDAALNVIKPTEEPSGGDE